MGVATCPMCRAPWSSDGPTVRPIRFTERLDAGAVRLYLNWLYSGCLRFDDNISSKTDAFILALLKGWEVAIAMIDEVFKHELVRTYFTLSVPPTSCMSGAVLWAFVEQKDNNNIRDIRKFLVENVLAQIGPGWFRDKAGCLPDVFVRELAETTLESLQGRMSYEEFRRLWLNAEDDEENEDEGDEISYDEDEDIDGEIEEEEEIMGI